MRVFVHIFATCVLMLACAAPAKAAIFTLNDPDVGYTLQLPGTWKVLPQSELQQVAALSLALGVKDTELYLITPAPKGAGKDRLKPENKALLAIFAADYTKNTSLSQADIVALKKQPQATLANMLAELNSGIASNPECKKLTQKQTKDSLLFCYSGPLTPTDKTMRTTRCLAYRFTKKHMISVIGQFNGSDDALLLNELAGAMESMDIRKEVQLNVTQ